MGEISEVVERFKPAIVMVVVQLLFVGIAILYKLVVYDGMNLRIVIAYRFIFATLFMAPLALIFERKRPKMTWTILCQGLICGLFGGTLAQTMYLEMLALTTVTFTSAMVNLTPAATFLMALSFGLEKLNWRQAAGKAKMIGTLVGISGAMFLIFYKGTKIPTPSFHVTLLPPNNSHVASSFGGGNTFLGALCALGNITSFSLWLVVQGKMSAKYPCYYSSATMMNLAASVFSTIFALCTERDWNQWKLGWNIRLLTVTYAGLVPSGLNVVMIAWCVRKAGPLFVSIFNPLQLLFLALVGSFFMAEMLSLGSIIGGVLIVSGLYMVLWGKGKEMKNMNLLDVPPQTLHVSSTPSSVEIVVKSCSDDHRANNDDNSNSNTNTSKVVGRDYQDPSENRHNQAIQDG